MSNAVSVDVGVVVVVVLTVVLNVIFFDVELTFVNSQRLFIVAVVTLSLCVHKRRHGVLKDLVSFS